MANRIIQKQTIAELEKNGLLQIGDNNIIDEDVYLCHWFGNGEMKPLKIGSNCKIRSGTVIYGDVEIGDGCNFGQHVVIREGCRIGNNTSVGTGVKMECYTTVGNGVSIETQAHITGWMTIEDYVFIGGAVMTTNDLKMKYKREGHGQGLKGATLRRACRIGSGAILLPGIEIGYEAVVNAGETVRKNVPAEHLYFTKKGKDFYSKLKQEALMV